MADVAIDPQNSNPKELFGQGVRAYVLQDFDTAVRAFSKASELLSIEHGNEIHDSLGDVYLYYGKSLLELSRKESGPLGEAVLKNVEEESESEEVEEDDTEEDNKTEDKDNKGTNKTDDQKVEENKPDTPAEESEKEKVEDDQKSEPTEDDKNAESTEDDKNAETTEGDKNSESTNSAEKKEGEENEDELSDLQVAWEVLELAKRIFTNRGVDGKKNLAETLIILGEISLESGNYPSAIEDIVQGLEIQKTLFGNDSRTIAETYYKLGGAYSTNAQIDEAVESFNFSLEYLQNKINNLKKDEEHKEANSEEIQEIENLVPEIQEKIADMKNLKAEIAKKMTSTSTSETAPKTNGTSEASSSKQVNDISHLVKRKRKEDGPEDKPAKRPSP